jgi:hypothetical protein
MPIYKGGSLIRRIYKGSTQVQVVYRGSTQIYPTGSISTSYVNSSTCSTSGASACNRLSHHNASWVSACSCAATANVDQGTTSGHTTCPASTPTCTCASGLGTLGLRCTTYTICNTVAWGSFGAWSGYTYTSDPASGTCSSCANEGSGGTESSTTQVCSTVAWGTFGSWSGYIYSTNQTSGTCSTCSNVSSTDYYESDSGTFCATTANVDQGTTSGHTSCSANTPNCTCSDGVGTLGLRCESYQICNTVGWSNGATTTVSSCTTSGTCSNCGNIGNPGVSCSGPTTTCATASFVNSTLTNQIFCSVQSAFTCNCGTVGQSYVSACLPRPGGRFNVTRRTCTQQTTSTTYQSTARTCVQTTSATRYNHIQTACTQTSSQTLWRRRTRKCNVASTVTRWRARSRTCNRATSATRYNHIQTACTQTSTTRTIQTCSILEN